MNSKTSLLKSIQNLNRVICLSQLVFQFLHRFKQWRKIFSRQVWNSENLIRVNFIHCFGFRFAKKTWREKKLIYGNIYWRKRFSCTIRIKLNMFYFISHTSYFWWNQTIHYWHKCELVYIFWRSDYDGDCREQKLHDKERIYC
jgi:hypothetical protein